MLVGFAAFAAGQIQGLEGLLYYGAAYTFMNLGAFAVIAAVQRRTGITSNLSTFAGLVRREPVLATLMALFLLSLTGIPPTAGFFGKFYVILAAVQAGQSNPWMTALAVLAMLNAAAAAFYYLRVVVYMFMREPDERGLRHGPRAPGVGRPRRVDGHDDHARAVPGRPARRRVDGRQGDRLAARHSGASAPAVRPTA